MLPSVYIMDRFNGFLDKIYENRAVYLRYFAVLIAGSVLRTVLEVVLSIIGFSDGDNSLVAFCLFTLAVFAPLKLWVFKRRCNDIFSLFTQISVYIMCMGAVWIARSIAITLLFVLTSNTVAAMGIGGVLCELLCLALMINIVFKKKND